MIVCRSPEELGDALEGLPSPRALVPTMGGLHDGHLSLVRLAHEHAETVLVTLFVNRAQFDDPQDYAAYPREEQRDFAHLEAASADLVYAPDEQAVWGGEAPELDDFAVPGLTDVLEGEFRGAHLCAVAAVVTRLLDQMCPDLAIFGEKDYQQLVLVRRLAALREPRIGIIAAPVIREPDGLAMSSRNRRLSAEGRKQAVGLYRALSQAAESLRRQGTVENAQAQALSLIESAGLQADYVAIRDAETLQELTGPAERWVILAAAWAQGVRLLDCVLN